MHPSEKELDFINIGINVKYCKRGDDEKIIFIGQSGDFSMRWLVC